MTEQTKSRRINFTETRSRLIPVGRGFIELPVGFSGPVKSEVADFVIKKGWGVEIDGEPVSYDTSPNPDAIISTDPFDLPSGEPEAEDVEAEPPMESFEGSEDVGGSA